MQHDHQHRHHRVCSSQLKVKPQTVQNYLSHLSAVFAIAKPAWGYALDRDAIKDAFVVAKRLGVTSKGNSRDRRPTPDELNRLMLHFGEIKSKRPHSAPMQKIIAFAIFSTRRQEEITRITWDDYEQNRVLVRDMKNPGDKIGNNIWCDLPPEASAIIDSMPKTEARIFPYSTDAISAAFTRACKMLAIEDLHFHDLRHDGVSRLFEMGKTIPQAASVSGHRSLAKFATLYPCPADWRQVRALALEAPIAILAYRVPAYDFSCSHSLRAASACLSR